MSCCSWEGATELRKGVSVLCVSVLFKSPRLITVVCVTFFFVKRAIKENFQIHTLQEYRKEEQRKVKIRVIRSYVPVDKCLRQVL